MNSIPFRRIIIATTLILCMVLTVTANATVVRLNKGLEVKVKFAADTKVSSGEFAKGDSIDIELAEAIIIDDSTIVEAGAPGKAVVLEAEKNGRGGKAGYIKVAFVNLQPKGAFKTEGEAISISGELENKGKGKKLLSYLFIAGLFIKGSNGELNTDETYIAKISESIKLRSE